MAIQILPGQASAANLLGQGFGSGLGQGLQQLAENKMQQVVQRQQVNQTAKTLEALGIPTAESNYIASLPSNQQSQVVSSFLQSRPQQQGSPLDLLAQSQQYPGTMTDQQGLVQPENRQLGTPVGANPKFRQQSQQSPTQMGAQPQAMQQQPGQQGGGFNLGQALLDPRERQHQEKLAIQKEDLELKKRSHVESSNSPYLKSLEKRAEPYKDVKRVVGEMKELLSLKDEKGNPLVKTGTISSVTPNQLQNDATQAFVSKIGELVTLKAQVGKGVPSRQRLLLEQASKPNVWHKPGAIEFLLNSYLEAAEPHLKEDEIKDQLIKENNGRQPEGLETKVKQRLKKIKDLPPADEYEDGSLTRINGKPYLVDNGNWVPL